ncbi:uncharacterized protein LOC120843935 [Ixodes scapularis]|uniref:uncharacterized protein LOC120843935 n=1 Tax=Ixodes scapularis TaxID=6945 RepID=UPI001A9CD567|nr:uncharacterized protein LOC120843935 [Ixodes scapularis]
MENLLPGLMTHFFGSGYGSHPSFIFLQTSATRMLESARNTIVTSMNASCRKPSKAVFDPPVILCDQQLSPGTLEVLSYGPKFSPNLPTSRVDQLTSVHKVASHIPEQGRSEFLNAAVRSVRYHPPPKAGKFPIRKALEELRQGKLKLLESDKTGVFVVMDQGTYGEKVTNALEKNFDKLKKRPSGSLRAEAKRLCTLMNLPALKKTLSSPAKQYFSVFFTAKTHKEGVPLRSIVSERGCWQKPLALFLQKHLSTVTLLQPFRISNSTDLISHLTSLHSTSQPPSMFSLDIEELYYSLDPQILLNSVSDAIHEHGLCKFQNTSGITAKDFIDLIALYLQSTLVEYNGNILRQKKGVCIGSCLAPILSEVFLMYVDRSIKSRLDVFAPECRVFRYVDDYLVIHPTSISSRAICEAFDSCSSGLRFTSEEPTEEGLQYLDLRLHLHRQGICWSFQQRSKKPVLPFCSNYSKLVKLEIIRTLFASSRSKSCPHLSSTSVQRQHDRLLRAGYPADLLRTTLQRLITGPNHRSSNNNGRSHTRPACVPYVHNTSHRLRSLAARFDTKVVFTCRMKLKQMCQRVNNDGRPPECTIKHVNKYVKCREKPIYSIPLSCGSQYIGQTGRCLNVRLREHFLETNKASSDSYHPIVVHARTCQDCSPSYANTTVLGSHNDKYGREIIEAFKIKTATDNVSEPSLSLSTAEMDFLAPELS